MITIVFIYVFINIFMKIIFFFKKNGRTKNGHTNETFVVPRP